MLINENMLVSEVLDMNPDITEIFIRHGLNCLGCPGSYNESLKEAADAHSVNLENLVKDLDNYLENKK
ncbi:DUF1858 domain-containing protein [Anaerovorax odorimutans]|uniref:DUF1858 domain-containing protein n=1 Tax=Anaerovorax odorimutans TaxID=109327 RepID=UPI00040020B7|nr:DUF1858 domain-containing protein [Anaerovorax odorimutans]